MTGVRVSRASPTSQLRRLDPHLWCRTLNLLAIHLNRMHLERPETRDIPPATEAEKVAVQKAKEWNVNEAAYKREHITKPATIGMIASSDPVAMLAWYVGFPVISTTHADAPTSCTHRRIAVRQD